MYKKIPRGLLMAFLFSLSSLAVQSQETRDPIQGLIDRIDNILQDEYTFGTKYQADWTRVQDMLIEGNYKAARGMLKGMESKFSAGRAKAIKTGDQDAIRIFGSNGILADNYGFIIEIYLAS